MKYKFRCTFDTHTYTYTCSFGNVLQTRGLMVSQTVMRPMLCQGVDIHGSMHRVESCQC
jgi:hypothetical protein